MTIAERIARACAEAVDNAVLVHGPDVTIEELADLAYAECIRIGASWPEEAH